MQAELGTQKRILDKLSWLGYAKFVFGRERSQSVSPCQSGDLTHTMVLT